MFHKIAQKLLHPFSVFFPDHDQTQVSITFPEPANQADSYPSAQAMFYLSELVVKLRKTTDDCVVRALITEPMNRIHVRYHWFCVGIFPRDMLEAVRHISNDQIVHVRKANVLAYNVLEYVVRTTGFLPILSPPANPWGSLAAKLNQQQFECLQKLVAQKSAPAIASPSQSDTPRVG